MIGNLLATARGVLVTTLGGVIPDAAQHITDAPVSPPDNEDLPVIALRAGDLTFVRQAPESQNSQPRPQAHRQRIEVAADAPQGPYALPHQPLQGNSHAVAILAEGQVAEQRVRLQEHKDFTIDYAASAVTFLRDVSSADAVLLTYSFVGIFTVQDFQQTLQVEVYAATIAAVEQLASLASGTLLTAHDELIDAYNRDPAFQTVYTAGDVTTTHRLGRLQIQGAQTSYAPVPKMTLSFLAAGQITAARLIHDGFGLIEKVRSPGVTSEHPVDIEIGVE